MSLQLTIPREAAGPANEYDTYQDILNLAKTADQAELIRALESFLATHPGNAVAHNDLGVLSDTSGNKEKALRHYEEALRIAPSNSTFRKNLADFYYVEQGRTEDALQLYVMILADNPTDSETLLILGNICISLGKLEDARVFFRRICELDTDNADARHTLTLLERHMGIAAPVPANCADYLAVANLISAGQTDEAHATLAAILKENPGHAAAHNDLGVLLYQQGTLANVLYHFEQAARLAPDNIVFQKNLADYYFKEQGRTDDAIDLYLTVLNKEPDNVETLLNLGYISSAVGRPEEAKLFIGRALDLEPENETARQALNMLRCEPVPCFTPSDRNTEAPIPRIVPNKIDSGHDQTIIDLKEQLRTDSASALAHNDLGTLLHIQGDKLGALFHYGKATQLAPTNITFRKNLADFCFVELGEIDETIELYLSILNEHPDDSETLVNLGHICIAVGQPQEATLFFRRATELEPWNTDIRHCFETSQTAQH